jgi:transposase
VRCRRLKSSFRRDRPKRHSERIDGDDTTVPVLAKVKMRTGRLWTYVRDDQPFGGAAAPAAVYIYSPDRGGEHPERHLAGYAGILQADAYAGFNKVYKPERKPGPIIQAACWAHARRKFFELADIAATARGKTKPVISPIAFEAVQKIDAVFTLERAINGLSAAQRVAARRNDIAPLVNDLIAWLKRERAKLSRHNDVAKAMDYMLKRIDAFTRFLDDGRICLSNNAAERALRGIALGRKSWLFAGSDRGGERAAIMLTLIQTAKLNNVDPQAWLADVLARIADHKITDLAALLPWHWNSLRRMDDAA